MGNRAVIASATEKEKGIGIYVHWNGGVESVEAFLAYCEMKEFRAPTEDCYGWAYLTTVIGNFFGDGLSVGIDLCDNLDTDSDNGVYYIDGWKIVGRSYNGRPLESDKSQLYIRLLGINEAQSEDIRVSDKVIKEYCKKNDIPINVPAEDASVED